MGGTEETRWGSLEHCKGRVEDLAKENDDLRQRLDLALARQYRRCAFLRGMNRCSGT